MASIINATTTNGVAVSGDNSGELQLQTNSGTTAVTLTTGQGVKVKNTIGVGDATPSTSGAGITFPATQSASSDANTLDDYEEGTWTPTCSSGVTSPSYSRQAGSYTRVGNLVHIQVSIQLSGGTRNSSQVVIGNLPFISSNFNGGVAMACAYVNSNVINSTSTNIPTLYLDPSSISVGFYNTQGATFVGTNLVDSPFRIDFAGTYLV